VDDNDFPVAESGMERVAHLSVFGVRRENVGKKPVRLDAQDTGAIEPDIGHVAR
jgi:hypothetical protein